MRVPAGLQVATGAGAHTPARMFSSNLDRVLRYATGLSVSIAEQALRGMALGTGRCLEEMKALKHAVHKAH